MARKKFVPYLPPFTLLGLVAIAVLVLLVFPPGKTTKQPSPSADIVTEQLNREFEGDTIKLPTPAKTSRTSVEQALNSRRSRRAYQDRALNLNQISQLLWAAQGVTADWGGRTAPSARDAYPLTVYLIANNVTGLESGLYQYLPGETEPVHELGRILAGDFKEKTAEAGRQSQFQSAPVVLIITGNFEKTAKVFERRVDNNVYLEAGHAGQNLYLQSESLGLGMVVTGGFDQQKAKDLLILPANETPIYMVPIGYSAE